MTSFFIPIFPFPIGLLDTIMAMTIGWTNENAWSFSYENECICMSRSFWLVERGGIKK